MKFLERRIIHGTLLLISVSVLCFLLSSLTPGSFFDEMKLNPQISPQTVAALRLQYGIDQPLPVRYLRWVKSIFQGEWGYSFAYNTPVRKLLLARARNTLLLTVTATILAWLIAIFLGVWTASRRTKWEAWLTLSGTTLLLAVPELVVALGLLYFAVHTRMLPVGGMISVEFENLSRPNKILDLAKHIAVPVTTLVLASLPVLIRHIRASVIEVLEQPFIQAARGHGISRMRLLLRHALPAAANPLTTLLGLSLAGLLSGALSVEVITGWPGLGPLMLEAAMARDLYVVVGIVMASTLLMLSGNLLADVALVILDPRVRVE